MPKLYIGCTGISHKKAKNHTSSFKNKPSKVLEFKWFQFLPWHGFHGNQMGSGERNVSLNSKHDEFSVIDQSPHRKRQKITRPWKSKHKNNLTRDSRGPEIPCRPQQNEVFTFGTNLLNHSKEQRIDACVGHLIFYWVGVRQIYNSIQRPWAGRKSSSNSVLLRNF